MSGHGQRLDALEAAGEPSCRGCLKVALAQAQGNADGSYFQSIERINQALLEIGRGRRWTEEELRQRAIEEEAARVLAHAEVGRLKKVLGAYDRAVPPSRRCSSCFRCASTLGIPALAARVWQNMRRREEEREEQRRWEQENGDGNGP